MKIRLFVIGKTEAEYLRKGIAVYENRIRHYIPFEIVELPAIRNVSGLPATLQKAKEAALFDKVCQAGERLVLLDEKGKELTSVGFSEFLNKRFISGSGNLSFLVGGPFGFDESITKKADFILSLSKMTFSHQMVRLFFTEQLYRALTILRGESYHHE